ncbi:putative dynamin GTPase [Macrophomina phaseolina]|uniref:Dynamin GTPase n=1 Tax=Macrophomina phaseolina TaxID=35725 RepID=A0ABQ8FT46_9PEZI|nr:putative dynamin GTPase [Macrophomina phaseolina]
MAAPIEERALGQLQNDDQSDLLDAIDELRAHGISRHINLPQLIVCGDQSAGKSSLLEAITQLPFPTKDGICTTFATEVALRRSTRREVKITIIPGPSRSDADKERLRRFHATFTNASDFPRLIDDAKRCINPPTSTSSSTLDDDASHASEKSINDDVLHLDISGPSWPPLTIVDLPGLIQSESRGQTPADVRTVKALVRRYMANPRSVILAVVAAHYDFANQGVLRLAREADPQGQRTLGIITKPDRLNEGTEEEKGVVRLAKNVEHPLALGWHVVRNRDHRMEGCASEERDRAEREFFDAGIWKSVMRQHVGVDALRKRLGGILLQQIRRELPALVGEIKKGIEECEGALARLGEPRENARDQREFLVRISKDFEKLTADAVNGTYRHPFFKVAEGEETDRRLRSLVQNSNEEFARVMRTYGHQCLIDDRKLAELQTKRPSSSSSSLENVAPRPTVKSRLEYLEGVKDLIRSSRGLELPGTFNPLLVADLFRNQSQPWEAIAKEHADVVWQTALEFLQDVLGHLAEGDTYFVLLKDHVEPAMDAMRRDLLKKVQELLYPYRSAGLITYHPQFVESVKQTRKGHRNDDIIQNLALRYGTSTVQTTLEDIARVIASTEDDSADDFASVELLYCMEAFYKVALNIFVDNIATLAVENCLIGKLADIFSPTVVALMDDETLSRLASETEDIKNEREVLKGRLKSLQQGARIIKRQAQVGYSAAAGR